MRQGAVLAPQQGITHDEKGDPIAWVVAADNTVEQRSLQTGRAVADKWLVTSGLRPGDRLIVEGGQFTRPGSKVVAQEYHPLPAGDSPPLTPAIARVSANQR